MYNDVGYPFWYTFVDDPEVPKVQNHRAFLKEHVVFKEVN